MINTDKIADDYYSLRQKQKENKEAIKKIVDNSPEVGSGKKDAGGWEITRSQIMLDIEEMYNERKGSGPYDYSEDILDFYYDSLKTPYEDLEKLVKLFIDRKIIKRSIGRIKGSVARQLYNIGKKNYAKKMQKM